MYVMDLYVNLLDVVCGQIWQKLLVNRRSGTWLLLQLCFVSVTMMRGGPSQVCYKTITSGVTMYQTPVYHNAYYEYLIDCTGVYYI